MKKKLKKGQRPSGKPQTKLEPVLCPLLPAGISYQLLLYDFNL